MSVGKGYGDEENIPIIVAAAETQENLLNQIKEIRIEMNDLNHQNEAALMETRKVLSMTKAELMKTQQEMLRTKKDFNNMNVQLMKRIILAENEQMITKKKTKN